jgi:hypothetical protein
MSRRDFIWYIFVLFMIGAGVLAVFGGHARDGFQVILLGGVIAIILFLTGERETRR